MESTFELKCTAIRSGIHSKGATSNMLQERTQISNVGLITLKIYREAGAGLVGIAEKQSFPNRKKKKKTY